MWDPRTVPVPRFSCLYQLYADWTSQGQVGARLSSGCCFLLHGLDGRQQYLWKVQSASFSGCLRKHTAAGTSCTAAVSSEHYSLKVRLTEQCVHFYHPGKSFPWQDRRMLKALIQPSTAWIEMKWWKYKKEDFITLSFRLCNPLSPSCVAPAFWAELY